MQERSLKRVVTPNQKINKDRQSKAIVLHEGTIMNQQHLVSRILYHLHCSSNEKQTLIHHLIRVACVCKAYHAVAHPFLESVIRHIVNREQGKGLPRRFCLNLGFWALPADGIITGAKIRQLAVRASQEDDLKGFTSTCAAEGGIMWEPNLLERILNDRHPGTSGGEPQIRAYDVGCIEGWDLTVEMSEEEKNRVYENYHHVLRFGNTEVRCVKFWAKYQVSLCRMVAMLRVVRDCGWKIAALEGMREKRLKGGIRVPGVYVADGKGKIHDKSRLADILPPKESFRWPTRPRKKIRAM